MAKDYTRYDFNGKTNLPKTRLVWEVIKKYVEDHPDLTVDRINEIFPQEIQGSMKIAEYVENIPEDKLHRLSKFNKDEKSIHMNGKKIAIAAEWNFKNILRFIRKAEELGYEIVKSESFFPETTDEYEPKDPKESDFPMADKFLFAFIQFFSKKNGHSENQKKILQFHLSQQNYSTTARIITENLGLTNIGHANMLCGQLAKGLCQILGRTNYRYFVEILFDFKKTNDFNNELQWILHPPVVEALKRFFSMSEDEKAEFIEKIEKTENNYWIFQGNPQNYNIVKDLIDNNLDSWSVKAHQSRIKKGDKVILWVSGKDSGCYALCEVSSDIFDNDNQAEKFVGIKITHNLVNNPILRKDVAGKSELSKLKAGNQGTNFESNKLEYETFLKIAEARLSTKTEGNMKTKHPLNLILYGPPGTGKTYNTTAFAVRLIEGGDPFEIMTNLKNKKLSDIEIKKFAELRKSGQIEFITFHQSYSYEDFVEGIKPDLSVENEQMKFRLNEGIFKKICATAEINSKLSSSDNQKYLFEDVWHNFIKNVDFSLDEEKEVPMKTTSFFIYDYNETTIRFRKKIGKSIHTLAFATLKKMFYEGKNNIISGGLEPYYSALLSQLMKVSGTINNDSHEPKNFVLIIDEINRGNISRIFGELITLIEEDKRDGKLTVKLPYSQEDFTVPSNLFIIGTMNTADRSIALLDIALRRRFTFFRFDPRPELVENTKAKEIMIKLNEKIKDCKGADFQIGHSYFMKITNDEEIETVLKYKINPLLEEYFVNDPKRLEELKSLMDKKS